MQVLIQDFLRTSQTHGSTAYMAIVTHKSEFDILYCN